MRVSAAIFFAALGMLFAPSAALAESVWLVYAARMKHRYDSAPVMDKIEMSSMEQCEIEGSKLKADEAFKVTLFDYITYSCVKGK